MTTDRRQFNRDELLKTAALDIFGLLDEYEATEFSRAFHDAPASVQDEIVALQADLAADPVFQANEAPPPDLRDKVLERVGQAVEEEAKRLAPIATIGRGRALRSVDLNAVRALDRSARVWRAASFALAASLLVVFFLFARAANQAEEIARLALNNLTSEQLREMIGPDFESFVRNPNVTAVAMKPQIAVPAANAVIRLNDLSRQAFVYTFGLPEGAYLLRARIENGSGDDVVVDLKQFTSDGFEATLRQDIDQDKFTGITTLATITWEIVDLDRNLVVLST